jgi:hypothetical protein
LSNSGAVLNTVQFFYLLFCLLVGIWLAGTLRMDTHTSRSRRLLAISLAILIVALLCVGVVSRTIVRHIIQAIPPVVALILVAAQSRLAPSAAAPICTFWLGVMINIWLFVLGIARIFSGTFSAVEIALTIVIALASGLGILSIVRWGTRLTPAPRLATAAAFGVAQFAAMVASFQFG